MILISKRVYDDSGNPQLEQTKYVKSHGLQVTRMVLAVKHWKGIAILLIVIVLSGLVLPMAITPPSYEIDVSPAEPFPVSSSSKEDESLGVQLSVFRITDGDPENDYYFIEYHLLDIKHGNDSTICPSYITVQLNVSSCNPGVGPPKLLLTFRHPDPGWLISYWPLGMGAGHITFHYCGNDTNVNWARWNIGGFGGWPLIVHVMKEKFVASIGLRVQEGEGLVVSAQVTVTWVYIGYLGTWYVNSSTGPEVSAAFIQ